MPPRQAPLGAGGLVPGLQHEIRASSKVHPLDPDRQGAPGERSSKNLTQWTIIAEKTGVQTTKDRLKSFWTTLGVVSALLAALTYPAVTAPAVNKHNTEQADIEDPVFISYVLLNTLSLILSFIVVILSVVLLAEVDLVVTDEDLDAFINRYQYLFLGLTGIFGCSMLTIIGSIVTAGFYNFSTSTAIAATGICLGGVVVVAVIAGWVALWTRSRLKFHISEANVKMRAAVQRLLRNIGQSSPSMSTKPEAAAVQPLEDDTPRQKPTL